MTTERKFTLKSSYFLKTEGGRCLITHLCGHYLAGWTADGRQVLASHGFDSLEVVWFDASGRFQKAEVIPHPRQNDSPDDPYYPNQILRFVQNWMDQVGFRDEPITIEPFSICNPFSIRITLLFDTQWEFLRDPYYLDNDLTMQDDMYRSILAQINAGHFVFRWGYYEAWAIRPDGEESFDYIPPECYPQELPPPRRQLYPLQPYGAEEDYPFFACGILADGRQALMGRYGRNLVLVLFAADGTFLEYQTQELVSEDYARLNEVISEADERMILERRTAWQAELGWRNAPIRIQHFRLPHYRIFIADYPGWANVFRHDPYFYSSPQEREEVAQQVREWEASGNFVFWWGRDYHVDNEGNVIST
jgi:hypothetical protein